MGCTTDELSELAKQLASAESRASKAELEVERLRAELKAALQEVDRLSSISAEEKKSDEATKLPMQKLLSLNAADDSKLEEAACGRLEQLPLELLTRILSMLDQSSLGRFAQLSRLCHRVATQPILWQRIRIAGATADTEVTQRLGNWLGASLRKISAIGLTSSHRLPQLLAASANLTCLILQDTDSDVAVTEAGFCCPNLRELRLTRCRGALSASSLVGLLDGCAKLSTLEVSHEEDFSNWREAEVFDLFVELVSHLEHVVLKFFDTVQLINKLSECPKLVSLTVQRLRFSGLLRLLSIAPNLNSLSVQCLTVRHYFQPGKGPPPHHSSLRRLIIHDFLHNDPIGEMAEFLLPRLPALSGLRLDCFGSGQDYRRIVQCLPAGLTDLWLQFNEQAAIDELDLSTPLPPSLQRLELMGSSFSTDNVAGLSNALAGCSALTRLTLEACTDGLLQSVLGLLPRLSCLVQINCSRLTRQAWTNFQSGSLPQLQYLVANNCTESSLTDEAVADLCSSPVARRLQALRLSSCQQLTVAALGSIASGCPQLTRLILVDFSPVKRDERIEAAFERRVNLSRFWLQE